MPNSILAESLARIEYKLDLIVKHFNLKGTPLSFPGQICPVCNSTIDYQVDIMKQVVVRKCLCSTGKIVMTISLNPAPGAPNGKAVGNEPANSEYPTEPPSNDRRRR